MKKSAKTLLTDCLSEVTRRERRNLLGISMLSIAMVHANLVPTKITALGIEFGQNDRGTLLFMISLAVIYFLVAFVVYGASDFSAWRLEFNERAIEDTDEYRKNAIAYSEPAFDPESEEENLTKEERQLISKRYERHVGSQDRLLKAAPALSLLRACFDFGLPIVVGLYAVLVLNGCC